MTPIDNRDRDHDATVSYSIKELLRDIKGSVDMLYGKVDRKADTDRVDQVEQVVLNHATRIDRIENRMTSEASHSASHTEWRRYLIPTVLAVVMAVVAVVDLFLK